MQRPTSLTSKKHFASQLGITDAKIQKTLDRLEDEAKIEDENVRRLIGDEPNEG